MVERLVLEGLIKLTVPQLKAICKEKRITAYSKLAKGAIIQKILALDGVESVSAAKRTSHSGDETHPVCPSSTAVAVGTNPISPLAASSAKQNAVVLRHVELAKASGSRQKTTQPLPPVDGFRRQRTGPILPTALYVIKENPTLLASTTEGEIRQMSVDLSTPHCGPVLSATPKDLPNISTIRGKRKAMLPHVEDNFKSKKVKPSADGDTPTVPPSERNSESHVQTLDNSVPDLNSKLEPTKDKGLTSKRFVPLVVKKLQCITASDIASTLRAPDTSFRTTELTLGLDFPRAVSVSLQPISLPPSLSQRKKVNRLAEVFSFLHLEDLRILARVSRLFRYAGALIYVSAVQRLKRMFPGRRLNIMLKRYPQNSTNMWPYLRQRLDECIACRRALRYPFLTKVIDAKAMISERLWINPDNFKQVTVAASKDVKIIDIQEVVEGEIWSVEISAPYGREIIYILESTCEVIGKPLPSIELDQQACPPSIPLRADWSAYINQCLSSNARPPPLLEHVKSSNHEEYHRGISKLWLSKTQAEGEAGEVKRLVAERYILACVVGNR
ncbi:hypothetical protein H0H81_004830 [Sphagnurus paluster]|uniref:Rho termination factor N-terminal domain-containing protein n=1 Tax=Sphagnurus paluster TaxID=117069 RepID=A0A9P7K5Z5_9AGAR|nr:hypothetical protein H0H81_004830 [Sphagnurus paluster]